MWLWIMGKTGTGSKFFIIFGRFLTGLHHAIFYGGLLWQGFMVGSGANLTHFWE